MGTGLALLAVASGGPGGPAAGGGGDSSPGTEPPKRRSWRDTVGVWLGVALFASEEILRYRGEEPNAVILGFAIALVTGTAALNLPNIFGRK